MRVAVTALSGLWRRDSIPASRHNKQAALLNLRSGSIVLYQATFHSCE
jgi:hypothetical protein